MEFRQSLQNLSRARALTAEARESLYTLNQKLANERREKDEFTRRCDPHNVAHQRRLEAFAESERELAAAIKELAGKFTEEAAAEAGRLKDFSAYSDPRTNLPHLDDSYPILLLPLRLETRFKQAPVPGSTATHPQLWIRVFPDDIAVDSFESILSKDEIRNAKSYWLAMWKAADVEAEQRGAWRSFVSSHGSGRAYWITQTYAPLNTVSQPAHREQQEVILVIGSEAPLGSIEKPIVQQFWEALWRAGDDSVKQAKAQDDLINALQDQTRAGEILARYAPFNLAETPPVGTDYTTASVTVAFVEFPDSDALNIRLQSWSVPPTVNVLPERLVVQAFYGNTIELNVIGGPIASPLIVGPDPSAPEGEALKANGDDLEVGDAIRWMIDFDEAVARGMGFKIDLTATQAERGFDRVVVLGVRMSASAADGQQLVETLFKHHHCSRKGFGIIRQGTPTNNTEKAASGYQWQEDSDVSFDHYHAGASVDPNSPAWTQRTDGQWLTDSLGINAGGIDAIANYTLTEQVDAKAMNLALWPATLGYFMETMMSPVFNDETIMQTRAFYTRYVSGRGAIPAIRVGSQPYGILPTTTFSRMNWLHATDGGLSHTNTTAESVSGGETQFLMQLYRVLLDMDKTWTALRDRVPHVGLQGDAHQILLDIIGLHPDSVEVHSRFAQSLEHLHNYYNLIGLPLSRLARFSPEKYIRDGMQLLERFGYRAGPAEGIPDILTKFFFGKTDRLTGRLVDDGPLSETANLRAHTTAKTNYIEWLIDAAKTSHDALRRQQGFIDDTPPAALLYLLLQHALDLSFIDVSLRLYERHGLLSHDGVLIERIEPRFIHIEQDTDRGSRWKYLYREASAITGSNSTLLAEFIPTLIGTASETQDFGEILEALAHLSRQPSARLERALVEHLDTCAYRYDAWMLGLVSYQLHRMRNITDHGRVEPRRGVYVGAYGWLEEVRPKQGNLESVQLEGDIRAKFQRPGDAPLVKDNSNGGYIIAPSLNHAVTAAVLRNGYISNNTSSSAKPFAINLSSERVRLALGIIDGIRSGQSLAALLGYQLERGLHDRHDAEVDEVIYDLRLVFPLQANHMQSTQTTDAESINEIEARNVVDGLALIEQIDKSGIAGYPFGVDLPDVSPAQKTAINAEVQRLIEINDAVADLATAEGVHQVAQGNYDRATAVFESYSKGHLPPVPDVVQTPRSGVPITHRVGLQFKSGLSPADPSNTTPRSKAEPALNDWLRSVLPALSEIVCVVQCIEDGVDRTSGVPVTAASLKLEPIDLLYLVNTGNEQAMSALDDIIHRYVYETYASRPDAAIRILYTRTVVNKVSFFQLAPLIDSLRALVLHSRPLNAGDVRPSGEAKGSELGILFLDPLRVSLLADELSDVVAPQLPAISPLREFIDAVSALLTADDVNGMIDGIDTFIENLGDILAILSRFGLPQTGTGFLYDWRRRTFASLMENVATLVSRMQAQLTEFDQLMTQYPAKPTASEKLALLQQAERLIAVSRTVPSPLPGTYRDTLLNVKRPAFAAQLNRIKLLRGETRLTDLFQGIIIEQVTLRDVDLVGIDSTEALRQLVIFMESMKAGATNLEKDITQRLEEVHTLLAGQGSTTSAATQTESITNAARKLLHDDFKMIPQFSLTPMQADEWQNAMSASGSLLRYAGKLAAVDFPLDDWLYGTARVREKMHHLENATILVETLAAGSMELRPVQLPYRKHEYWLGMPFPDTVEETGEPFVIDEDKLLYTAIYADSADGTGPLCGLLLDEWMEVIPAPDATTGLTFHYDQPNSEPPQTLLLVTPSDFRGAWQWQDLADALQETLQMAKKRAVEPDQIDTTEYGKILPALVSAATAYPITAAMNLAMNNKYYLKTDADE